MVQSLLQLKMCLQKPCLKKNCIYGRQFLIITLYHYFMFSNHLANFPNPIDHQSVHIRVHFATHNCILEASNFTTGHLLNFPSSQSDASSSPINKTKTDSLLEHSRLLCCCSTFFFISVYKHTRAGAVCFSSG
jgi:hypothetical protein